MVTEAAAAGAHLGHNSTTRREPMGEDMTTRSLPTCKQTVRGVLSQHGVWATTAPHRGSPWGTMGSGLGRSAWRPIAQPEGQVVVLSSSAPQQTSWWTQALALGHAGCTPGQASVVGGAMQGVQGYKECCRASKAEEGRCAGCDASQPIAPGQESGARNVQRRPWVPCRTPIPHAWHSQPFRS